MFCNELSAHLFIRDTTNHEHWRCGKGIVLVTTCGDLECVTCVLNAIGVWHLSISVVLFFDWMLFYFAASSDGADGGVGGGANDDGNGNRITFSICRMAELFIIKKEKDHGIKGR